MGKLIVYAKSLMLKLSLLLKALWQSFYQRLFLAWRLPLRGICIFLLLIMVAIVSCSTEASSLSDNVKFSGDVKIISEGLEAGKHGKVTFVFPQRFTIDSIGSSGLLPLYKDLIELSGVGGKKDSLQLYLPDRRICYFYVTPKSAGVLTITIPAGSFTYYHSGSLNRKITADFIVK